MEKKRILKNIAIIISIIVLFIDICLYIKLYQNWTQMSLVENSYESAGLLIATSIQFGTLIYGIGLVLIVWIEYFFITMLLKFYNKFKSLKRTLLILTLLLIITIFLIIGIKVLALILTILI